jgi:CBS domain-containing protein
MLVGQIMRKDFFVVRNTDVMEEAVKKMREKHVGLALVYEEDRVSGIVTEEEIKKAMAEVPGKSAQAVAGAAVKTDPTVDDGHRCCYFNDAQIELIVGGSKAA